MVVGQFEFLNSYFITKSAPRKKYLAREEFQANALHPFLLPHAPDSLYLVPA